jgi:predicted nucleic acid-binding protein
VAIILIDSCVVLDLGNPDSDWFEWSASTLERLDASNTFVINPVVYAECAIGYSSIEEVETLFESLGFQVQNLPREALFLAGKAFMQYRRNKGNKTNVLPDFFIGAHAAVSGYPLVTRDKSRFSTYFPSVKLIAPSS